MFLNAGSIALKFTICHIYCAVFSRGTRLGGAMKVKEGRGSAGQDGTRCEILTAKGRSDQW